MRFGPRWLFGGLSFEAGDGDTLAVTGPNGSGKTTLLRILAGVLTPTQGEVTFRSNGHLVSTDDRALSVAFVAPYLQLYDGLTLEENLDFVVRVRPTARSKRGVSELVDRVGLSDRKNDLVRTFSSGMKQRARFAAALAGECDLLLLDEPSSNLDDAGVDMVKALIAAETAAGTCVVIATNSRQEEEWCERSLRIDSFSGPPRSAW